MTNELPSTPGFAIQELGPIGLDDAARNGGSEILRAICLIAPCGARPRHLPARHDAARR
jgi:hypothetical protein